MPFAFPEARTRCQGALEGAYDDVAWHHMLSDLNLQHA